MSLVSMKMEQFPGALHMLWTLCALSPRSSSKSVYLRLQM